MHEASDVGKHNLQEETELNPFNYWTTTKEQKLKNVKNQKQYISLSKPSHFQPFLLINDVHPLCPARFVCHQHSATPAFSIPLLAGFVPMAFTAFVFKIPPQHADEFNFCIHQPPSK